jgi:hypothetical protein
VPAFPVAGQRLQAIGGRHAQVAQILCLIQHVELSPGAFHEREKPFDGHAHPDTFRRPVAEGLDHASA